MEERWREREEQRRIREEARAEKRDALITALLNKLERQEMWWRWRWRWRIEDFIQFHDLHTFEEVSVGLFTRKYKYSGHQEKGKICS